MHLHDYGNWKFYTLFLQGQQPVPEIWVSSWSRSRFSSGRKPSHEDITKSDPEGACPSAAPCRRVLQQGQMDLAPEGRVG